MVNFITEQHFLLLNRIYPLVWYVGADDVTLAFLSHESKVSDIQVVLN